MKAYNSAHLLFSLIKAISRNDWPESFKLAPINGDWTARALKGTFIPDIPPRLIGLPPEYPASTITGCNNPNAWALTYDDGPGPYTLDYALKPLQDNNLKATFYVTGQQVADYPDILKQIYDDGHSIGIHSW